MTHTLKLTTQLATQQSSGNLKKQKQNKTKKRDYTSDILRPWCNKSRNQYQENCSKPYNCMEIK